MPVAGTLKHENRIVGVDESSIIGVSCAYRHVKIAAIVLWRARVSLRIAIIKLDHWFSFLQVRPGISCF